mgnify:CR=1 FL=1
MSENKREKFKRLAESRTNKILDMLDLLGNCSNTNVYDYTKLKNKILSSAVHIYSFIKKQLKLIQILLKLITI